MALDVNIIKKKEGIEISLKGSLDADTYSDCEKKMMTVVGEPLEIVLIDMKDLNYITSAGLGVIFKFKKAIENKGGKIVLANLQPNIKKIFEAVKVISEDLFVTLEGSDNLLDRYIAIVDSKSKQKEK